MKTQYHYYADASLKFSDRLAPLGQSFDRAFSYDQVSMLKEAYSGGEARDYVNGTTGGTPGPYRQTYQHDTFGNLKNRVSRFWEEDDLFSATYLNNRRQDPAWQFDADGRLKQDGALQYNYDASGENRSVFNPTINSTTTFIRDGDGRQIKRNDAPPGVSVTNYYLRSSVLNGHTIAELSSTGQKHTGYVFAGNEVLAVQQFGSVTWKHVEPLTGSSGQSIQNGTFSSTAELEPSGVNIGTTSPFSNPPEFSPEPFLPALIGDEGGCGSNPNCVRCSFHGSNIPCALAGHMMAGGFTSLDPEKTSPSALEKLAAQPIYGTFCVDTPVATVGATVPSTGVGMGAAPTAPPAPSGRTCTTELTGYTEGTMANSMNLMPLQPQNPPTVKNATPNQQSSFNDAFSDLWTRLHANGGNNPCAEAFGGIKKAEEALRKTNFSIDATLPSDVNARTVGSQVLLNPSSDRALMTATGSVYTFYLAKVLGTGKTPEGHNVTRFATSSLTLSNVTAGSFVLAHELGHRRKIYGSRQNDADFVSGAINNAQIWEACFKETTPVPVSGALRPTP